jgi:hypothetical protein
VLASVSSEGDATTLEAFPPICVIHIRIQVISPGEERKRKIGVEHKGRCFGALSAYLGLDLL